MVNAYSTDKVRQEVVAMHLHNYNYSPFEIIQHTCDNKVENGNLSQSYQKMRSIKSSHVL